MEPLFIGPYNENGVITNLKPFMIPENAFPELENVYVFRGEVRKKDGYTLVGQLRQQRTVPLGNSAVSPWIFNLFTLGGIGPTEPNKTIVPGSLLLTIGAIIFTDNAAGVLLSVTPGNSGTINYATGDVAVVHTAGAGVPTTLTVDYYPGLPVTGLRTRLRADINEDQLIAFDPIYSYQYNGTNWEILPSTMFTFWTGQSYQLMWTTNWEGAFWATNFVPGLHAFEIDPAIGFTAAAGGPPSTVDVNTTAANTLVGSDLIYFLNVTGAAAANNLKTGTVLAPGNPLTSIDPGTNTYVNGAVTTGQIVTDTRVVAGAGDGIRWYDGTSWHNFTPPINPTTALTGALIILPFKDRLVCLNTYEGNTPGANNSTQFPQRARWSQNGTPYYLSAPSGYGAEMLAWRDDVVGRGGFVDAPTSENIVSAGFIKDDLIVYFERSTWRLVYTGNEILPFVWQRINAELGSESTFSTLVFDGQLMTIGQTGMHSCDGTSCIRMDLVVPDTVWQINNSNFGTKRVYAIRDFFNELAYFSYTNFIGNVADADPEFSNVVWVYNYRNNTFSYFRDNFTCYGYLQRSTDYTWETLPYTSWIDWSVAWGEGSSQSQFPYIVAGTPQGFVVQIDPDSSAPSVTRNILGISGTSITCLNHGIKVGDYIKITQCIPTPPAVSYNLNNNIYKVLSVPSNNNFTIGTAGDTGYLGNGVIKVLQGVKIKTKMFTPYWKVGKKFRFVRAQYLLDRTDSGQISVNVYTNTSPTESLTDSFNGVGLGSKAILTTPEQLTPRQYLQNQIWHEQKYFVEGETFQVELTLEDPELSVESTADSDVVLHAMILYFDPAGRFL